MNPTAYKDINALITYFSQRAIAIFEQNLTGIYLTGSLSYNAFNHDSSDIDITVMLTTPISSTELNAITQLHQTIEQKFQKWSKRFECTYTPIEMLSSIKPPSKPRPWYWGGEGILYPEAPYGNEWITNNYVLYNHAISLHGPDFKSLMAPVDIIEVQKACIRDLFVEWVPKKDDPAYFSDSHYTAYFILNLCRIFYTIMCQAVSSKKIASSWVIDNYGNQWGSLVHNAQQWRYGVELPVHQQALQFLDFVVALVSQTELFNQLKPELPKTV